MSRAADSRTPSSPRSHRATEFVRTPTSSASARCVTPSCLRMRRTSSGVTGTCIRKVSSRFQRQHGAERCSLHQSPVRLCLRGDVDQHVGAAVVEGFDGGKVEGRAVGLVVMPGQHCDLVEPPRRRVRRRSVGEDGSSSLPTSPPSPPPPSPLRGGEGWWWWMVFASTEGSLEVG